MKKKILSTLLAAAMVLTSCLPAFAEGEAQTQPVAETSAVVTEETPVQPASETPIEPTVVACEECSQTEGHATTCSKYVAPEAPKCTCEAAEGEAHKEGCPLYVAPEEPETPKCTCEVAEGEAHKEGCPLYVAPEEPETPKCTCEAAEGEAHKEGCPLYVAPEEPVQPEVSLYDALMACTTMAEVEALTAQYSEEELNTFMSGLGEEQLTALQQHIYEMENDEIVVPETVVFTEAGPFLPPVNVAVRQRRMMLASGTTEEDALVLNKVAVPTADGNGYTITLEAYTTGTVTSETKTVPADIILVLDQSGSMAYDFNGDETDTNENRRQYAMKEAVNNFIGSVAEKYTATADHRMAIVTFGSNASILQDWTFVNEAGKNELQGSISNLPDSPSGATNVAAGVSQAETLMGSEYNYTGTNTIRSKVVIVFTDGVPTIKTDFNVSVADGAIKSAKTLKEADVTVYTIGIFNGVAPAQLYGDKYDYSRPVSDYQCNGEVGDYWGQSTIAGIFNRNDFNEHDIPAGNRFLNYLSSNFSDTEEIGIVKISKGLAGGYGWEITRNFERTSSAYYLTANNSTSLNTIFQTISSNIETPSISLGASAVMKDVVSPYFDMPANTSDIKVYTAAANKDGTFADRTPSTLEPQVSGNQVSVSGFDFDANCVTADVKSDGTYGKKLIIEFTVTPKAGFLGGNNVPTNASAGVYENATATTPIEDFVVPTVNVPIPEVTVTAEDKNIYLLGTVDENVMKTNASVMCGGVNLLGDIADWQKEFVTIDVATAVKESFDGTDDSEYTVTATVRPKEEPNGTSEGTAETAKDGSATGKIYVFKPEITFKDSQINLGDTADYKDNFVSVVWKHGTTTAPASMGTAPALTYTYTPLEGNFTQDTPVKVTVAIGGTGVTQYVNFYRDACTFSGCTHTDKMNVSASDNNRVNFVVHIATFDLTIKKALAEGTTAPEDQTFVFTVTGQNNFKMEVVIPQFGSVTIKDLPVGTYTITENTAWSWRYNLTDANGKTVSPTTVKSGTATVTFTNELKNNNWLSGTAYADNNFTGNFAGVGKK